MCPQKSTSGFNQRPAGSEPTVGDAGRSHCVFAAVDNRQSNHQSTVIEASSVLHDSSISILFDSGASNSFISPLVVERCGLMATSQGEKWQVELASGSKLVVEKFVQYCSLSIGALSTKVNLRILPLGSYDVVLGMDWLSAHRAIIDCHRKAVRCFDDSGKEVEIVGV